MKEGTLPSLATSLRGRSCFFAQRHKEHKGITGNLDSFLYELTGQTGNPNYFRAIAGEPPVAKAET
jgi:hypothetical protein